jgi:hypothetical protein
MKVRESVSASIEGCGVGEPGVQDVKSINARRMKRRVQDRLEVKENLLFRFM